MNVIKLCFMGRITSNTFTICFHYCLSYVVEPPVRCSSGMVPVKSILKV